MKFKILFIAFLCAFVTSISAQIEQISTNQINWKGIEKWYADSQSVNVISFEGAQYPGENHLPFFNKRIVADPLFSYQAIIKNPIYIPVSTAEAALLSGNNSIATEALIMSNLLHERGTNYFDIDILPFINKDGSILKLQSFDLVIIKTSQPQKAAKALSHSYVNSSVLASGKFVKIKVTDSGVYKLTYEDLASMGIDPANVHIFGYGGGVLDQDFTLPKNDDLPELAIYMNKGSDGVFNSGDYILFYAQGIVKWNYDKTMGMFTHASNSYSKYGYYFVSSDAGTGKKIEAKTTVLPDSPVINTIEEFVDYNVYEKDVTNLISSGKEFYQPFYDATSIVISTNIPNTILTNSLKVRLDVVASSTASSSFTLSLNGTQPKSLSVSPKTSDFYTFGMGSSGTFIFTPSSDALIFNLAYSKPTSTSSAYLNYIEFNVRRQLKMAGTNMQFQNTDYLGQSSFNQYQLSDANSNVEIWDITDQQNISKIPTESTNGKMIFVASASSLRNYLAIDPTASYPKPDVEGVVPNQNLHAISQADMIIITHPNFLSQAQTLAQAHREKDNLTVEVVTTDQVYNEFSSGAPDATAYRWVMKMLYDRAQASGNTADLPKYLLLFGRGSFDNRKLMINSGDNLILTYQADNSLVVTSSYISDDYFTLLDDNEGTNIPANLMDIGVGRLPVATVQQANNVVNKIIGYMNNTNKGNWKNQICFLADDGDAALHMTQADTIASMLARSFPAYQVNKIYLDSYLQEISASGQTYPLAKNKLLNLIRSGVFLLDFTGHAGPAGWTNESVLSLADVKELSNQHLPFIMGATCDFLQFDVQTVSGGEQVVLNPSGGGIGILSAARPVYASQNFVLNKLVCNNLFKKQNGSEMRLGDVISNAKNNVGSEINKLSYVFMGDPAVKLTYPTKYKVITSNVNETASVDTLRALSVATVQGIVADDNGNVIDNFNGTLHAVVYDKVQRITTLNNEGDGALTYSDRPNTLFSGDATVEKGKFTFTFMLPKDIKYNYGGGRINYYAQDDTNNFEAQGYYENFVIGGTDTSYSDETTGPEVKLFLNSDNFVSGAKVNETPLLIANVSDTHGINTVGSGIGHDVMMTIDQDPTQAYVLNDYFQSTPNSFTGGIINYKLSELASGKHTLTLRVWDLLNNSTSSTINFEVVKGLTPVIFSTYNYPNPVKSQTKIVVIHDRPETVLSTTVDIFDLSGRKIWTFSQSSTDNISWDLNTNDGTHVKTGIYFYRVSIKTKDSDITSKTNKMLITE